MVEVRDLGLCDYDKAYALQKELVDKMKKGETESDYILVVEHPATFTFGRKSHDFLKPNVANVFTIERGGEATYHNPGQLVVYPIMSLKPPKRDIHRYVRTLEQVIIDTLAEFGLESTRKSGATGVWVAGNTRKIASLGIAVSGWVTYHGLALNVCNDLSGFHQISPCGFSADIMTSVQRELGESAPNLEAVKAKLVKQCECAVAQF